MYIQYEKSFIYEKLKKFNKEQLNNEFVSCCKFGNFEGVNFLLTSPSVKNKVDIHFNNDFGLRVACIRKNFDIVTFLLSSPKIKEHANIHANKDEAFYRMLDHEDLPMLKYFIFDLNIEKTKSIEGYLKNNSIEIVDS